MFVRASRIARRTLLFLSPMLALLAASSAQAVPINSCAERDIGLSAGTPVATGTTTGEDNTITTACAGGDGLELYAGADDDGWTVRATATAGEYLTDEQLLATPLPVLDDASRQRSAALSVLLARAIAAEKQDAPK